MRSKAFNIAKNAIYDGYQRRIVSIDYEFFVKKKTSGGAATIPNKSAIKMRKF